MVKSRRKLDPGKRARVLIVDDSVVMRRLIAQALEGDPCLEIVGFAKNGREAVEKIESLAPDAITMDIEMPEMDGLEAVRRIRELTSQIRIVMFSTLTERGAAATLEALASGADDYVTKQTAAKSIESSTATLASELAPKIKQFFVFPHIADGVVEVQRPAASTMAAPEYLPRVVGIGVSTGGPGALATALAAIPKDFPLPILIVQHMPPLFTKLLCERLQERSQLPVREAIHGEAVKPGVILFAPGDYHMQVELTRGERHPHIALNQGPTRNSCRPAVDVLFESLALVYGGAVVAAILTGMGQDGLKGSRLLKQAGAVILAQDEETSAVWGMPRAVVEANLASAVLPLERIVPQIVRCSLRAPQYAVSVYQEIR